MNQRINLKKPAYFAVIVAFFAGLAVHMFGLVNILHNHDDISMQPSGYGTGISSGRWVLTVLGDYLKETFGNYNLHWFNGVLFLAFVAVAAGFFVATFDIKSRKAAAVIGILFVSFPTATSTILFRFTAGYYGFAILLSVLAAWCAVKLKYFYGLPLAAICISVALGIYQAQIPLTISMLVLLLIKKSLGKYKNIWELVSYGVYYCLILICGLLLYYVCLNICLNVYDTALSSYQSIDSMGKISLSTLPGLIVNAYKSFLLLPTQDFASLAQTDLLRDAYQGIGICTVCVVIFNFVANRKKALPILVSCFLCILFPLAVNFVTVMCPSSTIYTLMVYAFVVFPCAPLVLFETLPEVSGPWKIGKQVLSAAIAVFVVLIAFCNSYMANVNYTSLYYANRQVENHLNSLVVQVRMTEGFDTSKKWAVIGKLQDPLRWNAWQHEPIYGGNMNSTTLLNAYSWESWLRYYLSYCPAIANSDEISAIKKMPEYQDMPCWPNDGSIQIIDEIVVIKLSE